MSTEITDLITDAFRENNLIAAGTSPTTAEQTEGLNVLNRFIDGLYGYELGENLFPWQVPGVLRTAPVAAAYPQLPFPTDLEGLYPLALTNDPPYEIWPYPPQNSRIIVGTTAPQTIWFPEAPDDGARMALVSTSYATSAGVLTVDSNGRGFSVSGTVTETLTFTPPITPQRYFYRADLGLWVKMGDLGLTDASPFPEEFDNLIICGVAYRLSARYGATPREGTTAELTQQIKRLKARYRQTGLTVYGSQDFPRALESYISGQWWW